MSQFATNDIGMQKFLIFCKDCMQSKEPHLRWGQVFYIMCKYQFPGLVVPEAVDPFYDDKKIPEFFDFLLKECLWN